MPIDLVIDDREQRADLDGSNGSLGLSANMIPMNNGRSSSVDASHHSENGYTPDQLRNHHDLSGVDIKVSIWFYLFSIVLVLLESYFNHFKILIKVREFSKIRNQIILNLAKKQTSRNVHVLFDFYSYTCYE